MAGTTIAMSKLKQVLRWKEEGYSNRKIAQLVGLNKETVNNYISRANADSLSQKELLLQNKSSPPQGESLKLQLLIRNSLKRKNLKFKP